MGSDQTGGVLLLGVPLATVFDFKGLVKLRANEGMKEECVQGPLLLQSSDWADGEVEWKFRKDCGLESSLASTIIVGIASLHIAGILIIGRQSGTESGSF